MAKITHNILILLTFIALTSCDRPKGGDSETKRPTATTPKSAAASSSTSTSSKTSTTSKIGKKQTSRNQSTKTSSAPASTTSSGTSANSTASGQTQCLPNFVPLVEKLKPTVVHIATRSRRLVPSIWGYREYHGGGLGTGVIIRSDGQILTNEHVIHEVRQGNGVIKVKLSDGSVYPAKIIGADPDTDIALLKINPDKPLPTAPLGNSDELNIGEWVIAIGNPFGLDYTVTSGIISAKNRELSRDPRKWGRWDYLQTDAAINPGNSGGPLINMKGQVIGINTAIDKRGQGIGYAIPINMVKQVIPHLEKYGHVERSYLGVLVQPIDEEFAKHLGLSDAHGVLVRKVLKGSAADKAGIQPGDIILEFNGKKIRNTPQLAGEASIAGIGARVPVKLIRSGKTMTITVVMGAHPYASHMYSSGMPGTYPPFGIIVQDMQGTQQSGVMVVRVIPGSPAARVGIQRGDVILKVDGKKVRNLQEYQQIIASLPPGKKVMLLVDSVTSTRWVLLPIR